MNENKFLILIKDKDKTEEINLCKYENGKYLVRFHNNSKVYTYNYLNLTWFKEPKEIDHRTCDIFENNLPVTGGIKILDFGGHVKVWFKTGYKKVYKRSSITIEETSLTNPFVHKTFEYLKTIANNVSEKLEDDSSFLSKQYHHLKMISPSSVLSAYLEGKPLIKHKNPVQAIYPFGFNTSQKMATEKALANQLSVIEGPPGTGKTQTILNIIANAILNNQTVAVVSNNNSATANVLEKLAKYEVDFIAAYLGNKENKTKFFAEQKGNYPNLSEWAIPPSEFHSINNDLKASQKN
ncbi:AAA family ATPase [Neobacillus cucumis]|uniref:AAA domain-containing protein n=1 Tax=Neobacillus cucumis TaxID=1740721 RepID=UPI002041559D|nr:AAA domain-containing protein [Neobacillus cucumis]MCM3728982.1 AAA family ATPase [Neobacillus cucumis]